MKNLLSDRPGKMTRHVSQVPHNEPKIPWLEAQFIKEFEPSRSELRIMSGWKSSKRMENFLMRLEAVNPSCQS